MRILYSLTLACLLFTSVQAQELSFSAFQGLGFAHNVGGELFGNGQGLQIGYGYHLPKQQRIHARLEARSIDWGNQLGLSLTYQYPYVQNDSPWEFSAQVSLHNSLALFRPQSLWVVGLEYSPTVRWQSKKRSFLQFRVGTRFNISPAYRNYGEIYNTWEIPIHLTYGVRLGKMDTRP